VTISDGSHSASLPQLDVGSDGAAVAAWQWHDPAGWRVRAAIRRPGESRFDKPQTLSPPAPTVDHRQQRPWIDAAVRTGGRAMRGTHAAIRLSRSVHAATRASASGPFGSDETISAGNHNALWPSVAMTTAGDALAAWISNTDGSGGGHVAAAACQAG
jgi:hypothetical protein